MEAIGDEAGSPGPRRSRGKIVLIVVLLAIGCVFAYMAGRSTGDADHIAGLVRTNRFIGKDAAEVRALVPKVVFEGGTDNAHTLCRVPGTFGDTYFELTFKDGKVIGARTMAGPAGKRLPE